MADLNKGSRSSTSASADKIGSELVSKDEPRNGSDPNDELPSPVIGEKTTMKTESELKPPTTLPPPQPNNDTEGGVLAWFQVAGCFCLYWNSLYVLLSSHAS